MSNLCTRCFKTVTPETYVLAVKGVGYIKFSVCPHCMATFHSEKINLANTKKIKALQAKFNL